MTKKEKIRYLSYLLAAELFIGSSILGIDYINDKFNDKDTDLSSPSTSYTEETINQNNVETEPTIIETETTIIETEPTIIETEPTIIETEPTIIETEQTIIETEPTVIETEPTIIETEPTVIETEPSKNSNKGIINKSTPLITNANDKSLTITNLNINDSCIRLLKYNINYDLIKCNDQIGFVQNNNIDYHNENIDDNEINLEIKNDIAVTTTNLNFRKEPNTNSEIKLTIDNKQELLVFAETDDNWLLVKYNDQIGYVKKDYTFSLKEKFAEDYNFINTTDFNIKKVVYTTSDLNIRREPNTESEVLSTLEKYESLRVLNESDDWYLIMTNEYNFGYVAKEYTKELNDIYIIVDLSKQNLYMYNDNNLYYQTKVTTGKDSTPSDKGLFKVHYKDDYCYITDTAFVDYWLNYNYHNEGIHDASWRKVYGEEDYHYNGSNGCINTPHDIMEKIYNKSQLGTKVLVHK